LVAAIGASFDFSAAAQPTQQPRETVELNPLPASIQQTIKQKAAGGEIVSVKRKDDVSGKWNYEVVVRLNGKESDFEVDPNRKLLKQQTDQEMIGSEEAEQWRLFDI
jgi:uncharacterized membrane protein YkoI